jgi:TIR domain
MTEFAKDTLSTVRIGPWGGVTPNLKPSETMPILFLSHSGADTENARTLKKLIEDSPASKEAGLKVWFDKDDLQPGKSWRRQLETVIEKEADAFAVLFGASGIVNWVEAEVDVALSRATTSSFPFIPIIAKESKGSDTLPAFARRYQGVCDPLKDSDELAKLIKAATGGDWDRNVALTGEPFVGLRSMDESWANRFFGRKGEVRELVGRSRRLQSPPRCGAIIPARPAPLRDRWPC